MKETNNLFCPESATVVPPVLAAPLAGITDKVYRHILESMGVSFCYTEMVCAKALMFRNQKTESILDISGEEDICGVQLFGADPEEMAGAAEIAVARGAKTIDINMGCPVPKVVNNGEGAALLKNIPLAVDIVKAMKAAVDVPLTVKLRRGFDGGREGLELAQRLEEAGVAAVTVHGRDRAQYYSGKADWDFIAEVKAKLSIPVIGNGDIFMPQDAVKMVNHTHCDGVMVARGMLGNPWLIRNIKAEFEGEPQYEPTAEEKAQIAIKQLKASMERYGDWLGIRFMRKFFGWYVRGYRGAAATRNLLNGLTEAASIEEALLSWAETAELQEPISESPDV